MKEIFVRVLGRCAYASIAMVFLVSPGHAQSLEMTFFLSIDGPGGTNFGAVVVADGHCQDQGYAAGFGDRTWKAYITGNAADGEAGEIARNRIGPGPFINYFGIVVAESIDQLHSDQNNLNPGTAVTATGQPAPDNLVIPPGSELDGGDFTRNGPLLCFASF